MDGSLEFKLAADVGWTLLGLLGLIGLNLGVSIADAVSRGEFEWGRLPDFIRTQLLGLWAPLFALGAGAVFVPAFKVAFYPAAGAVVVKFAESLKGKIEKWRAPQEGAAPAAPGTAVIPAGASPAMGPVGVPGAAPAPASRSPARRPRASPPAAARGTKSTWRSGWDIS